jgi:hypothetical protein
MTEFNITNEQRDAIDTQIRDGILRDLIQVNSGVILRNF